MLTMDQTIETMLTIAEVCRKQETGVYQMETVPCYCGASSPRLISQVDRYAMPCVTNLCEACGLLYVSPRMTAGSYHAFYEQEYRKIYRTADDHDDLVGLQSGDTIRKYCEFYDVLPTSVIDIGCGNGGILRSFAQEGIRCHGVDTDPAIVAKGQAVGLPIEVGSATTLIQRGVTADLVILHHVLEHCLDLPETLAQMRQLLTPKGCLFISVPGIYPTPIARMFQSAHVYHFTASTLQYVMECEGWRALMLNESVDSMWVPSPIRRDKTYVVPHAAKDVWDTLGANPTKIPELHTYNKFPVKMQRENIEAVLASGIPDVSAIRNREAGHAAIIIGGGPSIETQVETIHALIAQGCRVVAIERMSAWCQAHGIIPDYVSVLDASEDVPASLQSVHPETVCITATQCGQAVLDALKGQAKVYCYSCPSGTLNLPTLFEKAVHARQTVLNAGGSVTISCMTLAMQLGMSTLHIFGFDCHVGQGAYATGITGVGVETPSYFDVEIDGKTYTTTGNYFSFAQQFFPLMDTAMAHGYVNEVHLYGDSLVLAMGEEWLTAMGLDGD